MIWKETFKKEYLDSVVKHSDPNQMNKPYQGHNSQNGTSNQSQATVDHSPSFHFTLHFIAIC